MQTTIGWAVGRVGRDVNLARVRNLITPQWQSNPFTIHEKGPPPPYHPLAALACSSWPPQFLQHGGVCIFGSENGWKANVRSPTDGHGHADHNAPLFEEEIMKGGPAN